MKFSVLMSVYEKENPEYLKQAIDSILNQTLKPDEIVIVKDGKLTVQLDAVIDEYVKKYNSLFNIVPLDENKGLGIALNEGLKKCSHNIIARMDGDDICSKDRFEKQLELFKNDSNLDIIGSYIKEFDGNINNVISERKVPISDEEIKSYAKTRNPFNHMTVMYKKESVLAAGGYKHFMWNEDYYLWVRMIINGAKTYNIPENLVYARTGMSMFERRGGFEYAKLDFKLQKEFFKMGFISRYQFIKNSLMRSIVRIVPNNLRKQIYIKFLRKS